jgi:regulatory protein
MGSQRKPRLLEGEALLEYALRALAARAHTVGELREKLQRRAVSQAEAEKALRRLRQLGYLNDRQLAESYAQARLENEGLGKIRVLHELCRRRLAPELAEQVVEQVYAGAEETRLIEEFLRRKYRKVCLQDLLADPKGLASTYRRLRSAGFTAAAVMAVLRRLIKDPELLDRLGVEEEA